MYRPDSAESRRKGPKHRGFEAFGNFRLAAATLDPEQKAALRAAPFGS